jgi:hypothetical protein
VHLETAIVMTGTPQPRSRRGVNRFAIVIGGGLLLLALAAVYVGVASLVPLWPYEQH